MRKRIVLLLSVALIVTLINSCSINKPVVNENVLAPAASATPSPIPTITPTPIPTEIPKSSPTVEPSPTPKVETTPVPTPVTTAKPTVKPTSTPKPTPVTTKNYSYGGYTLVDNNLSNSSVGWYFRRSII